MKTSRFAKSLSVNLGESEALGFEDGTVGEDGTSDAEERKDAYRSSDWRFDVMCLHFGGISFRENSIYNEADSFEMFSQ